MITYEKFKEIIVKYIAFSKADELLRKFNIDIIDSPLFETTGFYLDWLWEAYFQEAGCDTISWWMFEYHELVEDFDEFGEFIGDPEMEPGMWDENDEVIPMVTIEDLWEYVKDFRKEYVKADAEKLAEAIDEMAKAHIQSHAISISWTEYEEILNTEFPEFKESFDVVFSEDSKLLMLDDKDEVTKDIMKEYVKKHTPLYRGAYNNGIVSIFHDNKVGPLLVITYSEGKEIYIWSV